MSEREIRKEDVEREHLDEANQPAHWTYLFATLGLSALAMLLLIGVLDRS